jgi:hypothetical protein
MRSGLALILCLLLPMRALGYVRSRSPKSGAPFTWLTSCIVLHPDSRGSQDLTLDELDAVLQRSATNWSDRTDQCGSLRLTVAPMERREEVAADGRPIVVFRDKSWRRPGGNEHEPSAIALTTVFHVSTPGFEGDGTILDTDVELNGVYFTFVIQPSQTAARDNTHLADLENTLTHEFGHVQGLAHTCWDHLSLDPPVDDLGDPIPDCNGPLPDSIMETTMYPYSVSDGETSKRSLTDDDVRGVCEVYPIDAPQAACNQQLRGGCSPAPASVPPPLGAELLAVVMVLIALGLVRARR